MAGKYAIGLDFGTNSVRALIVDVRDGRELGEGVSDYARGDKGVVLNPDDPHLARQHPADYLAGIEQSVALALKQAAKDHAFSAKDVIGIGVDTTGSTPLPVDASGQALALLPRFEKDPNAMAWLWKDHTSHNEAAQITSAASDLRPQFLAKCGGRYSSEWFWAKILHCARVAPDISAAAASWVEIADWIPAVLAGTTELGKLRRGVCAAGHKAFYNADWGGYPDEAFLGKLHPELARLRRSLPARAYTVGESAGGLSAQWAAKLGLPQGIPIAIGAFDAHLGAIGAGIGQGALVKVMGTSTCDIMVSNLAKPLADVPGLCGIVCESVLPGYFGLEAGQSAVGDIFNWFVNQVQPGGAQAGTHEALTTRAQKIAPGQSGLLALDWHNGNRTILVDQRLTGMLMGLTLSTTPPEIYRALIEATAFGARVIVERLEEYGVPVERVINCGGIAARNPMVNQIYADVLNRPIAVAKSLQTCALGSAIAASVVAGKSHGGHADFGTAIAAMSGVQPRVYNPDSSHAAVYERLFRLYRQAHDAFGITGHKADLSNVMKDLLAIRDEVARSSET
ncbi:MAG TPA: ribulokinase [Humisphaera sp.]|jgi:L-ribulokinase|nr:ribulokinase [Humisphaera sp.]